MKRSVTYRGVVYPWQCDHMGHMNVMWYVNKFDEATWVLLTELGLSHARLAADFAAMAAVDQRLQYRRELRAGDAVSITSSLLEVGEKRLTIAHDMIAEETREIAARCTIVGVYMDITTRRAQRLPADIRESSLRVIEQVGVTAAEPTPAL